MTRFCPFMSTNPQILEKSVPTEKTVPCMDNCALYWKGFCSINILAQKAVHDGVKEKKSDSVVE